MDTGAGDHYTTAHHTLYDGVLEHHVPDRVYRCVWVRMGRLVWIWLVRLWGCYNSCSQYHGASNHPTSDCPADNNGAGVDCRLYNTRCDYHSGDNAYAIDHRTRNLATYYHETYKYTNGLHSLHG